ncbi:lamin tail domain-containing protein [bacterium]|nr:lamin tail domain-containing protein [candidate division CSSED10-310 bacterium]
MVKMMRFLPCMMICILMGSGFSAFFSVKATSEHIQDPLLNQSFCILKNEPEEEIIIRFQCDPSTLDVHTPCFSHLVQISNTKIPRVTLEPIEIKPLTVSHNEEIRSFSPPSSKNLFIGDPEILRSIRVVRIAVFPFILAEDSGIDSVICSGKIRITFDQRDTRNVLVNPPPLSPSFHGFYKATVINYRSTNKDLNGDPENYLIIAPDDYESRLQGFIAWKEEEGFDVDVFRTSNLPNNPSWIDLKNVIQMYYNGPKPPVYILFCGDEDVTPIYYTYDPTHPGDYADDLYYSLLSGEDILPDIFLGRLPAEDAHELTVMLNKILKYECNPGVSNPDFYTSALMAASALEESQITTKEQTRERLEMYCGYQQVHTIYDWNSGSVGQVMDIIDQGVSIINYRGEGWRRGWNPLHEYWFDLDDVYNLENAFLTPYITSIGCGVCLFDTDDDCWGHAFLAHGSPSTPMGAVGMIGPTYNTHTTYNNWQDRGMYRGYVYWNVNRSCPMMDYGKLYMRDQFPDPDHDIYLNVQFRTYLCFGTPDMWVRMGEPLETVAGMAYANDGMGRYISVRNGNGDLMDSALVAYTVNGQRRVYPTDEDGGVFVDVASVPSNTINIVVTGRNLIPVAHNFTWTLPGNTGSLIITEIKPDILTDGQTGDLVELYNDGSTAIDLEGWILSDLDGYDTPFVDIPVLLEPEQLAIIEFVGPQGAEEIIEKPYGVWIKSREIPDFSSLEDIVVLRNPLGEVVDCLAWHDDSGIGSTNVAGDLERLTGPTSPFTVLTGGWWDGPDSITQETYELYTINWAPFSGNDGEGSIQRCSIGFPDGPGNFTVQLETGFGSYYHSAMKQRPMDPAEN